jgi:hypothetical protein
MQFRRSRGDLVFVEEAAEPVIAAKRGQVDAASRLRRY